ncbi:unnamed protein product [Lymnaea stagnalis]|uniref:HD domain-containing protein n=1 Tax=Lymnaea stagnalis TaxID=6523 RepID=A0AAV2IBG7_LYMST
MAEDQAPEDTGNWTDIRLKHFVDHLEATQVVTGTVIKIIKDQKEKTDQIKHVLPMLTMDELLKGGVQSNSECYQLFKILDQLESGELEIPAKNGKNKAPKIEEDGKQTKKRKRPMVFKIFNDPIHGNMQLHPVCQKIVDTPQFQRLRFIKQIGMVYFVFPGAAHNRFEHSLGVCHLAGQFARTLQQSHPYLGITDTDILCVEIAGLCQDLGRGPFSRIYMKHFLPAVDASKKYHKPSAKMFEHLLEENEDVRTCLQDYGISDVDLLFVKEQISATAPTGSTAWPYRGRPAHKSYLYEIVNNKRNGIDVYKWDYMARDCHHFGIKNNFDHERYMKFARVIEVDGEMQICMRDKEIGNMYNMFYTHYTLDKRAYKHKVSSGMEIMVVQALVKANEHVKYQGKDNKMCSLAECYEDMTAYTLLTDNVLFKILDTPVDANNPAKDLVDAQDIVRRIFKRKPYTCVHESLPKDPKHRKNLKESDIQEAIQKNLDQSIHTDKSEIIVKLVTMDFGMKEENPVERLKVYAKHNPYNGGHLKMSDASVIGVPQNFSEFVVRVYSTDRDEVKCENIRIAAKKYFEVLFKEKST